MKGCQCVPGPPPPPHEMVHLPCFNMGFLHPDRIFLNHGRLAPNLRRHDVCARSKTRRAHARAHTHTEAHAVDPLTFSSLRGSRGSHGCRRLRSPGVAGPCGRHPASNKSSARTDAARRRSAGQRVRRPACRMHLRPSLQNFARQSSKEACSTHSDSSVNLTGSRLSR